MTVRSGTCYCCDLYNCAKWDEASFDIISVYCYYCHFIINESIICNKRSCCFVLQWRLPQQLLWVCWSTKLWGSFHSVHFHLDTHRPEPRGLLHRHPHHSGAGQPQELGKIHIHRLRLSHISIKIRIVCEHGMLCTCMIKIPFILDDIYSHLECNQVTLCIWLFNRTIWEVVFTDCWEIAGTFKKCLADDWGNHLSIIVCHRLTSQINEE